MLNIFRENKNIFFLTTIIIILIIVLHYFRILAPAEKAIIAVLKPVQTSLIGASEGTRNFFGQISRLNQLTQENEELKAEVERLTVENSHRQTLIEESGIVEPQIKKLQEKNYQYVLARVISKGVDPTFKTMVINQGLDRGIKPGMPVMAEEMVIIGKIIEAKANRAQVMLLNDARSSTAGQVQNEDSTLGLITGEFGLALKMEMLPKEEALEIGQTVITSGLENAIPKGLIIGRIESVKIQAGEFFQTAYLIPLSEYEKIQIVSVITGF